MYLTDNKNFRSKDGCNSIPQNYYVDKCLFYNQSLMCDQCINGFALTSDSMACVKTNDTISNCRQFLDYYGSICKICDEGYYASDKDSCEEMSFETTS